VNFKLKHSRARNSQLVQTNAGRADVICGCIGQFEIFSIIFGLGGLWAVLNWMSWPTAAHK